MSEGTDKGVGGCGKERGNYRVRGQKGEPTGVLSGGWKTGRTDGDVEE